MTEKKETFESTLDKQGSRGPPSFIRGDSCHGSRVEASRGTDTDDDDPESGSGTAVDTVNGTSPEDGTGLFRLFLLPDVCLLLSNT